MAQRLLFLPQRPHLTVAEPRRPIPYQMANDIRPWANRRGPTSARSLALNTLLQAQQHLFTLHHGQGSHGHVLRCIYLPLNFTWTCTVSYLSLHANEATYQTTDLPI